MPLTRPDAISNLIRLAYKFAALVRRLVAEDGAVDSGLSAIVPEFSPHEQGVSIWESKRNDLSGAAKFLWPSPVFIVIARVVPLIHRP